MTRRTARLGVASSGAAPEGHSSRTLETALMPLRMEAITYTAGAPPRSRGGGTTALGNEILGVDRLFVSCQYWNLTAKARRCESSAQCRLRTMGAK